MKNILLLSFVILSCNIMAASIDTSHKTGKFVVNVPLTVDSFAIKGSFSGYAKIVDGKLKASKLKAKCSDMSTGIDLRDNHLKKKDVLWCDKHSTIILSKVNGKVSNGRGTAKLKVRGKAALISFNFKVVGKKVCAVADIDTKKYGIKGISYMGIGVERVVKLSTCVKLK